MTAGESPQPAGEPPPASRTRLPPPPGAEEGWRSREAVAQARVREIDALRGVAVLMVMAYHYGSRFDELYGHAIAMPGATLWGYYGVHVFFMISGLVILMTAERAAAVGGAEGVGTFLWNRAGRLFPAFWVGCGLTFAIVSWRGLPGREVTAGDALLSLTMVGASGKHMVDGVYLESAR